MSGSRAKALNKAFAIRFGKHPARTIWELDGYYPSEWRRLKKAYKNWKSYGSATRLFIILP